MKGLHVVHRMYADRCDECIANLLNSFDCASPLAGIFAISAYIFLYCKMLVGTMPSYVR